MRRILRYQLAEGTAKRRGDGVFEFEIPMPKGPKFLHAGMSRGVLCVWALVDDALPAEQRRVVLFGTGREFTLEGFIFIQTVQIGDFVWHIFDGGPE